MENKKTAKLYGKVARIPKDTNPDKFMEKIKATPNKIWYVLTEKQDSELHLIKYNQDGVDSNQFVEQLIQSYLQIIDNDKIKADETTIGLLKNITVRGNNNFSIIENIPNIMVKQKNNNGEIVERKLVSKITEDLIKLLK